MPASRTRPFVSARLAAVLVTAVLLTGLVPVTAAAQTPPASRGSDLVCPPPGMEAPSEPLFSDTEANLHADNIDCVAQYGIAAGVGGGRYAPDAYVERGQMATFVRNLVETALDQGLPAPDGGPSFSDTAGTRHAHSIEVLSGLGIVTGFDDGTYRPAARVNRAQMATYLANAVDFVDDGEINGSQPPAAERSWFTDTADNVHADNIDRLAEQGIVAGDGSGRYRPGAPVTRAQMATFVMQSGDHLAEMGMWWWAPFLVTVQPEYGSHLVGETHGFTVVVTERDGTPMPGESMEVIAFRLNTGEEVPIGTATTDGQGEADFELTGPDATDVDAIFACVPTCDGEDGVVGAGVALWAVRAAAGDTTTEDAVVAFDGGADSFDSLSIDDEWNYQVRRWSYDDGDSFRDERSDAPSQGAVSSAQFEERLAAVDLAEEGVCVAVEAYDPAGQSTFVLIDCETFAASSVEEEATSAW